MNLGKKIKEARIKKKLTQNQLCADRLTRNMLSAIENGKSYGSLDTLIYLAGELDIPLAYLFSEDTDSFYYEKKSRMPKIRASLDEKNYVLCISHIMSLEKLDDELSFILATCYFNLGINAIMHGSLKSGEKHLSQCKYYCKQTLYDTKRFESIIPLYQSICVNVNAPLLEFDEKAYLSEMKDATEIEFYKYLVLDAEYPFSKDYYKNHLTAKLLIKERKYEDALSLLSSIEAKKSEIGPNAFLMFGIYADMEICYKNLFDFESAYKYSSKRISLIEGFNS